MYVLYALVICFSPILAWRFEPCSKQNFQGVCDIVQGHGCVNLLDLVWPNELSMHDSINSIKSVSNCVRLYEGAFCNERSQAYYSGAWGLNNLELTNFANLASSVGPCMEYECANKKGNHGDFDCVSHDSIWSGEHKTLKTVEVRDENNPIEKYQTGFGGRIEYVKAKLKHKYLNNGKKPNAEARSLVVRMGKPGDVPGMIIGQQLGGDGTHSYNIFPQHSYIAMGIYGEVMDRFIYAYIAKNVEMTLEVNLHYENDQSTRPVALLYRPTPEFFSARNMVNL